MHGHVAEVTDGHILVDAYRRGRPKKVSTSGAGGGTATDGPCECKVILSALVLGMSGHGCGG